MKIKSPLHLPHKGECSAATCSRILQRLIGFLLPQLWFSDRSDQSDQSENQVWALPLIEEQEEAPLFVLFRPFRENSWAKNINRIITFPLPRKPQILAQKGAGNPSSLPARRYNKAVGGFPYCVSWQNKEASRHNKETDGQNKTMNEQKNEKKCGFWGEKL